MTIDYTAVANTLADAASNAEAALYAASLPPEPIPVRSPLVGYFVNDVPWAQAEADLGRGAVTRVFYGGLGTPARFTRNGIPDGVLLIVSVKSTTNLESYVRSIPDNQSVQVAFHHEPEGDYSGDGARFVAEWQAARDIVKRANPAVPFVFIGGAYQYRSRKRAGWSGTFIPQDADRYYLDTYQPLAVEPAAQDAGVMRFLERLDGRPFHGFTEYGRGTAGGPVTPADRVAVFRADRDWLTGLPDVRVWSYWHTTDLKSGTQWRLLDPESQAAWRTIVEGGTP